MGQKDRAAWVSALLQSGRSQPEAVANIPQPGPSQVLRTGGGQRSSQPSHSMPDPSGKAGLQAQVAGWERPQQTDMLSSQILC